MRLSELLAQERIGIVHPKPGQHWNKSSALHALAALFGDHSGVGPEEIEGALLERESLQSTGIGEGVAIPHGALADLTEQVAALLIVPNGVAFDAIDGTDVTILFGVVTPKKASGEHLKTLARISRLLRSREVRAKLVASANPQAAFELIELSESDVMSMPSPPREPPPSSSAGSPTKGPL